jgi:hypothetical protein
MDDSSNIGFRGVECGGVSFIQRTQRLAEFLGRLSNCKLFKEQPVPWNEDQ